MAHEISHESGRAEIAYAGETPWHGLGVKVDGLQTAAAMLRAAGLEWGVETRPLFVGLHGAERLDLGDSTTQKVDSHIAIMRGDTGAVLGVASTRYAPIQNAQAGDVVDALVAEGGVHVEVAGALGHGERCWMLSHIPGDFEVVRGDAVRPYFLLAWGHDGKHGLAGKLTPIRVVCNNTLTAAGLGKGRWSESADVYVRHTRSATLRIEEARAALGIVKRQLEDTTDAYRALAGVRVTDRQVGEYLGKVFPMDLPADKTEAESEEYRAKLERWEAHQRELLALYEGGRGVDIPGVAGTAWAAYNAVTEWVDHTYPTLQSGAVSAARQRSVLFGSYAGVKARALTSALALVG